MQASAKVYIFAEIVHLPYFDLARHNLERKRRKMKFFTAILIIASGVYANSVCGNSTGNETLQLSTATITNLQLALFLENLEVAFLRSGISNITADDLQYGTLFNQTLSQALIISDIPSILRTRNILTLCSKKKFTKKRCRIY
jgi:hypothetical protein